MSNIVENKEYTLDELLKEKNEAQLKIESAQEDINLCNERIATLSYQDRAAGTHLDYEEDIRCDEIIIGKLKPLITEYDKLIELKLGALVNQIKNDQEPELTEAEAQYIMDKYIPIVDEAEEEYKSEVERYAPYTKSSLSLETDEDIDKYNDIQNDYEDAEKNYNDCSKVLNYAQNIISQDFSKNK